ncbi:MAG: hypothetical protein K2H47_01050 [Muribaculaceae bacterium]|nr:hypothetical protein [Muribaculaceae bacterium]
MIITTELLVIGGYLAYEGVVWGVGQWKHWKLGKKTKEFRVKPELTEDDHILIEKCREIMKSNFPLGIEDRLKVMTPTERADLFQKLILELNSVYGVNITNIAFLHTDEIGSGTYGYYLRETHSIRFNFDLLSLDDPAILREMVDTIFHEMRHALQYKAVSDSSCNYGTDEQRYLWALNFLNYIPGYVDFAYYQQQILEADARQIAELSMKGF